MKKENIINLAALLSSTCLVLLLSVHTACAPKMATSEKLIQYVERSSPAFLLVDHKAPESP